MRLGHMTGMTCDISGHVANLSVRSQVPSGDTKIVTALWLQCGHRVHGHGSAGLQSMALAGRCIGDFPSCDC